MASQIADEAQALRNQMLARGKVGAYDHCLSPHIAIARDPQWGRVSETFGEDPMLQANMGVAFVRGLQGAAQAGGPGPRQRHIKVGATCNHFLGHDLERWKGHSAHNWNAEPRDVRDTFLPPFQACAAEAASVMCAFNALNGTPSCASEQLLAGVLREQMGFEGFVVTDNRVLNTITEPYPGGLGFADGSIEKASAEVIRAGADMIMKLSNNTRPGDLTSEQLDAAAKRVLMARIRLGHFDPPGSLPWSGLNTSVIGSEPHVATAVEISAKGSVLLKNEGVLPLDAARIKRLAVLGPFADQRVYILGRNVGATAGPVLTPLAALRAALPGAEVTFNSDTAYRYTRANAAADAAACEAADACVLFLGSRVSLRGPKELSKDDELPENAYDTLVEGEGQDRESLLLQGQQLKLWKDVSAATAKPLIVVLVHGGALDVSQLQASSRAGAILSAFIPGQHGAAALADILLGRVSPSGRTPLTWYTDAYTELPMTDLHMRADPQRGYPGRTYRYWRGEDVGGGFEEAVLYPFGHGLSYANFSLSGAAVAAGAAGNATASVTVTHAGGPPAEAAVLLFLSYLGPEAAGSGEAGGGSRAGQDEAAGAAAALPGATLRASGCSPAPSGTDLVQRLAAYARTRQLSPAVASQQLSFQLRVTADSSSSWAGFGDPDPPCGTYSLQFGHDQAAAAVLVLAP